MQLNCIYLSHRAASLARGKQDPGPLIPGVHTPYGLRLAVGNSTTGCREGLAAAAQQLLMSAAPQLPAEQLMLAI